MSCLTHVGHCKLAGSLQPTDEHVAVGIVIKYTGPSYEGKKKNSFMPVGIF